MTNPTNINTGSKFHLKDYRGIKRTKEGKLIADKRRNTMGPQSTACGLLKDAENFKNFHGWVKSHPESVCKKCLVKYREMMKQYREMLKEN